MMAAVSAQVSLYPLRRTHLGPTIEKALRAFERHGLKVEAGPMSTLIWGEAGAVFGAVQEVFQEAAQEGEVVMAVTLSNACPLPGASS
ncbi:MAG: YkoF family thiamine/hydroxymethylpyrimidine-binding protein [Anaerolineae bacterium]